MKTITNISNLKKLGMTIVAGMVLTTGTFASSAKNEARVSASKLDDLMTATEQSVRFTAPAVEESEDVFYAIEELNTLAESTETMVKYVAPAIEEEVIALEMENLNTLAEMIESNIKYVAPAVNETEEVAEAIQGLDELAASTEVAVAFKAPRADDSIESVSTENQESVLMLADETK